MILTKTKQFYAKKCVCVCLKKHTIKYRYGPCTTHCRGCCEVR